jgi:hypothetical protein
MVCVETVAAAKCSTNHRRVARARKLYDKTADVKSLGPCSHFRCAMLILLCGIVFDRLKLRMGMNNAYLSTELYIWPEYNYTRLTDSLEEVRSK